VNHRIGICGASLAIFVLMACGGCGHEGSVAPPPAPVTTDTASASGQLGRRLVPGAVAFAVASDVVVPSRIHVRWEIADRLQFPPDPIDSVVVAINYDEPADEKNWRTTTRVLGSFPRSARIGAAVFDAGHPDIVPGRTGWITVVPRHASGSYGAIERSVNHRITDGFFIDGLVIADRGGVAAGVEVTIPAHGLSTLTAPDGRFRFGPLSDESAFILQTNTPDDVSGATETGAWFDFTTAPIGAGAPPVTICLIDRTELLDPFSDNYMVEFGSVTKWFWAGSFMRWDHYPLTVYVPDGSNAAGTIDLGSLARLQVAHMNGLMGGDAWVAVADSTDADVRFSFEVLSGFNGLALLNTHLPRSQRDWGYDAPQRMTLAISVDLNNATFAAGVINHELGHSLYMAGHALGHTQLMMNGGYGEPTADDLRMFRSIMTIPVGTPFQGYEWVSVSR
jgi:hypothetical protein